MATDNDPDRITPPGDAHVDQILAAAGAEMLDYVRRRVPGRDIAEKVDRILRQDGLEPGEPGTGADGVPGVPACEAEAQEPLDLIARYGKPLLGLLACLADAEVPLLLLDLAPVTAVPEILPDVVEALASIGLIEITRPAVWFRSGDNSADRSPVIKMAQGARDTARRHPDFPASQPAYLAIAAQLLLRASERDAEHPGNWPWWQMIAPHSSFLLHSIRQGLTPELPEQVVDRVARAALNAARYLYAADHLEEADAELRAILETCQMLASGDITVTLQAREERACILRDRGYLKAAERELQALHEARRELLSRAPAPVGLLANTDWCSPEGQQLLERSWDPGAARPLLAMIDIYAAIATTFAYRAGSCEESFDRYEAAARRAHAAVYEARRRVLGDQHKDTLVGRNNVAIRIYNEGLTARRRDLLERAEREFQLVCDLERTLPGIGEHHLNTLVGRIWHAQVLRALDRQDEAEAELRDLYPACKQLLGEHHSSTLWAHRLLAELLRDRDPQAATAHEEAVLACWRHLADRDSLASHEGLPNLTIRDGLVWALITRGRGTAMSLSQSPRPGDTSTAVPASQGNTSTAIPTSQGKQPVSMSHLVFGAAADGNPEGTRHGKPDAIRPHREPQLSAAPSGPVIQQQTG